MTVEGVLNYPGYRVIAKDQHGKRVGSWSVLAPNQRDAVEAIKIHVRRSWAYSDYITFQAKRSTRDTIMVVHYV